MSVFQWWFRFYVLRKERLIEPDTHTKTNKSASVIVSFLLSKTGLQTAYSAESDNVPCSVELLSSWIGTTCLLYSGPNFFFLLSFRGSAATLRNCYRTLPTLGMPSLKAWWCSAGGMTTTTTRTGGSWESRASTGSFMTGRLMHCANVSVHVHSC